MGIFKRVRDITLAGVNEVLDSIECPISLIKQYMRDLEQDIHEAEATITRQITMEKQQERLVADTEAFVKKRDRQAKLAITTGEDQIAKLALQDKLAYEKKLELYQTQLETIKQHTSALCVQVNELQEKYKELQQKKLLLISRTNVAQSTQQLNRALAAINSEQAIRGFARMEERILEMEAAVEASNRLRKAAPAVNPLPVDTQFSAEVESEFAKLKEAASEPQE